MIPAPETVARLPLSAPEDTGAMVGRWKGRQLFQVRVAWIMVAALVLAVVVTTLPSRYAALDTHAGASVSPDLFAAYEMAWLVLVVAIFGGVAALLIWRRADDRMALFSAFALLTFPVYIFHLDDTATIASFWRWSGAALALAGLVSFTLLIYLFPDGRFVSRWNPWLSLPWLVAEAARRAFPGTHWDYTTLPALLSLLLVLVGLGPAVVVMVYRYQRISSPLQRQQTKWFVFGVTLAVVLDTGISFGLGLQDPQSLHHHTWVEAAGDSAFLGAVLFLPVSIGLAITRYRLWAIDILINRTLVYGVLTASVIGLYVLVVGTLSRVLSGHGDVIISLAATGLVALLIQPLRARLQQTVNRLLYGERDDPYQALSRLARRLEGTIAPEAVLPAIVETVARTLKLPYAAIELQEDEGLRVVAFHGDPVPVPLMFPLAYQQEPLGHLLLAPRTGSTGFSRADQRLLADLAHQAGVAVHGVRLTAEARRLSTDLQRARIRLVTLVEEERRRLRRDLHDGLGPTLACVTLQAETARDLLVNDPAQADALLAELTVQAQSAIADIRRVVYDLRPPALDDLGLAGAVQAHAAQLVHQELAITVVAPEELPPLPAAVEVAAYRIVQEALTNVVRHASARSCMVRLVVGDALRVEVTDDGCGLPRESVGGVGLLSMRERAAELGGACLIEAAAAGGVRIIVTLPVAGPETMSASNGTT